MRQTLRESCSTTKAKPVQVLATALRNTSDGAKAKIGNLNAVYKDMRIQRQKTLPPNPKSAADLQLPEEYKMTGGKESKPFLLFDSGMDKSRVIAFGTQDSLKVLRDSDQWFMDGTFNVSSEHFSQLYVIRAEYMGLVSTCVYAFMTHKTKALYEQFFKALVKCVVETGRVPNPKYVMLDFEIGAMSAIQSVLGPQVQVKGCFFHLCQSTWRHIQEYGLARAYKSSEDIKQFCSMIDALAFLPVHHVAAGMMFLWTAAPVELADLLLYFDTTYVSGTAGSATPPLFPPHVWNVHDLVIGDINKTNNFCETWNNRFKSLVGKNNAGFWNILDALREDEALERTKRLSSGTRTFQTKPQKNKSN